MKTRTFETQILCPIRLFFCFALAVVIVSGSPSSVYASSAKVVLVELKGKVSSRARAKKKYVPATKGAEYVSGTRLKTGAGAWARIKYADGSLAEIKANSEIVIKASVRPREKPNGVVLFFGRVWAKVTKSKEGETAFEVRSANAVAGVRGTEFETGVASDGTVKIRVSEGRVAVQGEDEESTADVGAGTSVQSDHEGSLGKVGKSDPKFDWANFFVQHAKNLENRGLKVAKALDGRLNRRKAKVERLVKEQKTLRQRIETLVAKKKRGAAVDGELKSTTAKLERVTARLEDMRARLEGAFGLFESWGRAAAGGDIKDGAAIAGMASNIAKIAADFADMIEEGTDLSEEGMDDLMNDMSKGKRSGPGPSAADELFK
jgi:hypothetical protein